MRKERRISRFARNPIVSSVLIATSFLSCPAIATATNKEPLQSPDRRMSGAFSSIKTALNQRDSEELFRIEHATYADESFQTVLNEYALRQAKIYGLTLFETQPYFDMLDKASSVNQILSVLNRYTRKLGFKVVIPDEDQIDTDLFTPINPKKIKPKKFKDAVVVFINGISNIPKEVISLSGLKTVNLVRSVDFQKTEGESAAAVSGDPLEMYITVSDLGMDDEIPDHEFGHMIDEKITDPVEGDEDEEYTALNPKWFEYGNHMPHDGVTTTDYGAVDEEEDKATTYEDTIGELEPEVFRSEDAVILAKGLLLLSRIEEYVPGYTAYARSISLLDKES